jgi:hypothetical protein
MNPERLIESLPRQRSIFEAIKAKHGNLYKNLSPRSDPLLLELADMIFLFSAQLALAAGESLLSEVRSQPESMEINTA